MLSTSFSWMIWVNWMPLWLDSPLYTSISYWISRSVSSTSIDFTTSKPLHKFQGLMWQYVTVTWGGGRLKGIIKYLLQYQFIKLTIHICISRTHSKSCFYRLWWSIKLICNDFNLQMKFSSDPQGLISADFSFNLGSLEVG